MELNKGVTTKTAEYIFIAGYQTKLSSLYLSNETSSDITIKSLYIQYATFRMRLAEVDQVISAGSELVVLDLSEYELSQHDIIGIETDLAGVTYLLNGQIIGATPEQLIYNNIKQQLISEFDTRYISITDSVNTTGETLIEDLDNTKTLTYESTKFFNHYFNTAVASLIFIDCEFGGVCKIKNTFGTITHTDSKGGYVITNKDLPDTLRGVGNVTASEF